MSLRKPLLLLLALALLLGACSRVDLAYRNLDWLIPWKLDDYLALDEQQRVFRSAMEQELAHATRAVRGSAGPVPVDPMHRKVLIAAYRIIGKLRHDAAVLTQDQFDEVTDESWSDAERELLRKTLLLHATPMTRSRTEVVDELREMGTPVNDQMIAEARWTHRNIWAEANQFNLFAKGSSIQQSGEASFLMPYFLARRTSLSQRVYASNQPKIDDGLLGVGDTFFGIQDTTPGYGLFSIGGLVGAAGVSALLWAGLSIAWAASIIALAMALVVVVEGPAMLPHERDTSPRTATFVLAHGRVLLIGILSAISFLAEGAVLDWSAAPDPISTKGKLS